MVSFEPALRYFMLMPEPEKGRGGRLHYKEEYTRMFAALADPDALKILFFVASNKSGGASVTPQVVGDALNLTPTQAENALEKLSDADLLRKTEMDIDYEYLAMYSIYDSDLHLLPFMLLAEAVGKGAGGSWAGGRNIPLFGKGGQV